MDNNYWRTKGILQVQQIITSTFGEYLNQYQERVISTEEINLLSQFVGEITNKLLKKVVDDESKRAWPLELLFLLSLFN